MTARILMCPPDFFGIEYEINPWMNVEVAADHALATEQWNALHALLAGTGAEIELLPPVAGLPDLVFTANAGLVYQQRALVSRFRHPQRQGESPVFRDWFAEHGFEVVEFAPPDEGGGYDFEGAGDALFCGDTLFAGYRMRSDATCHQQIGSLLGVRVIPVELVDSRYYHLDTCFCPLAEDEAIWYPPAFDDYGRRAIEGTIDKLIAVEQSEAERFACNAVVVGRQVFTNTGCNELHAELRDRGYEPTATPLDEFVKAGGSAKCLTLRLDGEQAASWRAANSPE
ncbi:dimethylarginine dimethylaminohydrolase family protein [Aeoliella mucimassa]|uniref:N(G),N(G)-dimethylarginine dimethylaminohydrolase n=1 Tax=Aeoliella mucimassa TaxID=2527972 RepID=A0A518AWR0_9BACT|nr:arginine deiminase-related protein [Aeoliella mucimassa]QDU59120.1 N(G),N(G)-dimethylarginine dimethylaminohydrolase [Aeoliella mucimassa]